MIVENPQLCFSHIKLSFLWQHVLWRDGWGQFWSFLALKSLQPIPLKEHQHLLLIFLVRPWRNYWKEQNWTYSKTFFNFYFKLEWNTSKDGHFASAVLNRWFVFVLSKWTVTQLFGQCSFWKSVINLTYSFEYIFCIWKF